MNPRGHPHEPAVPFAGGAACYVGLFVAIEWAVAHVASADGITPWYPPAGLTVAFLLLFGMRGLPIVAVAALLGSLLVWEDVTSLAVLFAVAAAHTFGYALGTVAALWLGKLDRSLGRLRDMVVLTALALLAPVAVAGGGVAALVESGQVPRSAAFDMAWQWWLGDALGVLVVVPLVLLAVAWLERQPKADAAPGNGAGTVERLAQATLLVACLWLAFREKRPDEPLFLVMIPLLWIVLRGGLWPAALAVAVIDTVAVVRAEDASSPAVQAFVAAVAATGMTFGTMVRERASERRSSAETAEYLRALVDAAPAAIMALDRDGRVTFWTKAAERLTGWPEEEVLGRPLPTVPPDRLDEFRQARAALLERGESFTLETERLRRDGSQVDVSVSAAAIHDELGHVAGHVTVVTDISERKRAERENARRGAMLGVVGAAAEGFLRARLDDEGMAAFLSELGHAADVSRAWLVENVETEGQTAGRRRAEWRAAELPGHANMDDPEVLAYPPEWLEALGAGRSVQVAVESAGPTERALLEASGTRSALVVPIRVAGRWWGTIGFDESRAARAWLAPEVDALRAAAGMIGAALDGLKAAGALEEVEVRFRTAFDEAAVGMAIISLQGRFTRVNQALCDLVGYTAEELRGLRVQDVTHPDDREANREQVERLLAGEAGTFRLEKRYVRKDGEVVWVLLNVSLVRDSNGSPQYFVAEMQDITERKRHEEELRESEQRFRVVADSAPVMIWMSNADGSPAFFNRGWLEYTGQSIEQALTVPWLGVHPDDTEEGQRIYQAALAAREGYEAEYRMQRADGECRWVVDRAAPRLLPDGSFGGLTGVVVDITERKLVEAERERMLAYEREQVERLRELDRMKDDFVATVSHELRTPLTNILGYLSLVLEADLVDGDRDALEVIDRNARRLLALVGDLLLVAQLDAGKLQLDREAVDLEQLVAESAASAAARAAEKGVELRVRVEPVAGFHGDTLRLGQLLDNLVSNAIKFTPAGGTVELRLSSLDGRAVLEVADTGVGIDEADQARLFERFFRTDDARRQAVQGSGLGLTIVKAIAEAHGGTVAVRSRPGQGTSFRVELPIRAADAVPATAVAA